MTIVFVVNKLYSGCVESILFYFYFFWANVDFSFGFNFLIDVEQKI